MKRIAQAFLKKGLPKKTIEVLDLDGLTIDERHLVDDMFKEGTGEKIMPTMVEIWKAEGRAEGVARGKAELLLAILQEKFNNVPRDTEQTILAMTDPIALKSWAVQASMCQTLDEFLEALG